jgi:hypothetical protein
MKSTNSIPHVIVRLMGGLGNQMFQYAFGYALAKRLNATLLLDKTFLEYRPDGITYTPRNYELDAFQLNAVFADEQLVYSCRHELDDANQRRLRKLFPLFFNPRCYLEQGKKYNPQANYLKAPVYLQGYWQSEKYFIDYADQVRAAFIPAKTPSELNLQLLDDIVKAPSVSIHVRRGDYISLPSAGNYHGTCSVEYYEAAAQHIVERTGAERFFIFSDEPDWVKKNIRLPYPAVYVSHNAGKNSHWDIYLMQHCTHHIVANSSFSWWGAWLNARPGKMVIAPAQWFRDEDANANDIVPPSWIKL